MRIPLEKFVFVDPAELLEPPDGSIIECLRDRWWPVDAQGRIAFCTVLWTGASPIPGAPVCSVDSGVAWQLLDEGFAAHEWGDRVVFFPVIFRVRDVSDFCRCI